MHTQSQGDSRGNVGSFSSTSGARGAGFSGADGNRGGVVQGSGGNVYAGADLASRYGIRGTPALMLIDAAGHALARADGYRDGPQTLAWLEAALRRSGTSGGVQSASP